jgi:hypothetical protein
MNLHAIYSANLILSAVGQERIGEVTREWMRDVERGSKCYSKSGKESDHFGGLREERRTILRRMLN